MCLEHLDRKAAETVITEPLKSYGMEVDDGLLHQLLEQLGGKLLDSRGDPGEVFPPFLQIVCDKLYRMGRNTPPDKHGVLRIRGDGNQDVGDVAAIIGERVRDVTDRHLSDLEGVEGVQKLARALLGALATHHGTVRPRMPAEELERIVDSQGHWSKAAVADVLKVFVERRLVRRVEEVERVSYELVHDCVAAIVKSQMNKQEIELERARDRLRERRAAWVGRGHPNGEILVEESTLEEIATHLGSLGPDRVERELLVWSAVQYGNRECGSSHKCMHDSGMISPITRRPKDEE